MLLHWPFEPSNVKIGLFVTEIPGWPKLCLVHIAVGAVGAVGWLSEGSDRPCSHSGRGGRGGRGGRSVFLSVAILSVAIFGQTDL